jgi:hypothetical protein
MNTTVTGRFARYLALPAVTAGIIGAAALGLAGAANAATTTPQPQPGIVATPHTHAHPAPEAVPGWRWHQGIHHLPTLEPGALR